MIRYDLDRDGRVTRAEYEEVLRAEFRWLDRNDDRVITWREAGSSGSGRSDRKRSY